MYLNVFCLQWQLLSFNQKHKLPVAAQLIYIIIHWMNLYPRNLVYSEILPLKLI